MNKDELVEEVSEDKLETEIEDLPLDEGGNEKPEIEEDEKIEDSDN